MAGKISLQLYILLLVWLGLGIICLYIPPQHFWPAGFMAYSLPLPLLLNLVFLLYWLLRFSWRAAIPFGLAVALFGLYSRSFRISPANNIEQPAPAGTVTLLSYNVRNFRVYPDPKKNHNKASNEFLSAVAELKSDILCIQEYLNFPKKINSKKVLLKRYPYHAISLFSKASRGNEYGLAIFSRYPVINKGTIAFGELKSNHAMFADIKVNDDTVRVYNYHLQSMSINREIIPEFDDNKEQLRSKSSSLFKRLRFGFITRGEQINTLRDHIDASPYPVIVTGDLNDMPHSYTYQYLRRKLKNSFEVAGSGMGTTFAGGFLPFLRIDNHFVSNEIDVAKFETLDSVRYSDHLPTLGVYSLQQ